MSVVKHHLLKNSIKIIQFTKVYTAESWSRTATTSHCFTMLKVQSKTRIKYPKFPNVFVTQCEQLLQRNIFFFFFQIAALLLRILCFHSMRGGGHAAVSCSTQNCTGSLKGKLQQGIFMNFCLTCKCVLHNPMSKRVSII